MTTCKPCEHSTQHAWWGPDLLPAKSHCRSCHRSWASLREGHCTRCCGHFSDGRAFEAHLTEDGCVSPASVVRRDGRDRFVVRARRFGVVWALADYRDRARRPFGSDLGDDCDTGAEPDVEESFDVLAA